MERYGRARARGQVLSCIRGFGGVAGVADREAEKPCLGIKYAGASLLARVA